MRFKKSTFTYPFSHNGLYYVVQTYTKKLFEIDKWLIIWDNYNRGDVYEVWWCFSKYSGYIGKRI